MAWYNIFNLFSSRKDIPGELYCSNPQCEKRIDEGPIAYDRERGKIYHTNYDCALEGIASDVMRTGKVMVGNLDYINRNQALRLLASGKLSAKEDLESKLTHDKA